MKSECLKLVLYLVPIASQDFCIFFFVSSCCGSSAAEAFLLTFYVTRPFSQVRLGFRRLIPSFFADHEENFEVF